MKLTVDRQCTISGAGSEVVGKVKQALTMKNPAYIEAKKHGRWTGNIDRVLTFYKEPGLGQISFPRGFIRGVLDIVGRDIVFEDRRQTLPEINFQFYGKLRPYQEKAVQDLIKKDFGVLSAPTGSGKTICALAVIVARQQPTLILVHTKLLLDQWCERIKTFLHVEAGLIGDGKFDVRPITVGIINSAKKHLDELPNQFGQIIGDENHRVPMKTYSDIVKAFDCRFMLGLSATPFRRDRLTKLIHWYVGPLVYKIDSSELQNLGAVLVPEIIYKQTDFYYNFQDDYTKMLSTLTQDEARNTQIAQDVLKEVKTGSGTVLVVSDRVEHCQTLAGILENRKPGLGVGVLTGQLKSKDRASLVEDIRAGEVDVVIATIQLVGEGIDIPELSSLFFGTPIKFEGRTVQTIGRILRPADGKTPRVFDYQDPVSVLYASARAREKTYRDMNWLK